MQQRHVIYKSCRSVRFDLKNLVSALCSQYNQQQRHSGFPQKLVYVVIDPKMSPEDVHEMLSWVLVTDHTRVKLRRVDYQRHDVSMQVILDEEGLKKELVQIKRAAVLPIAFEDRNIGGEFVLLYVCTTIQTSQL